MTLDQVLARIPYLEPHGLRPATDPDGSVRIRMPFGPRVRNHVGVLHAGALFTLAETAAGAAAWAVIPEDRAFVLLRGAKIRYTRRAESEVEAVARVEPDAARAARAAFEETAKADAVASVTVRDGEGAVVFEGSFDYALRSLSRNRTP